jgi:hypothetical protein
MRSLTLIVITASLAIILTACGGSNSSVQPSATPAPATITLTTNPNPPTAGDVELRFTVMDDKGQPVSGADFDVIADHTEMNGMIMHGKATDQGNGSYAIKTNFSMPGKWKLTVEVRNGELDFKQDLDLIIK